MNLRNAPKIDADKSNITKNLIIIIITSNFSFRVTVTHFAFIHYLL